MDTYLKGKIPVYKTLSDAAGPLTMTGERSGRAQGLRRGLQKSREKTRPALHEGPRAAGPADAYHRMIMIMMIMTIR
jgi:hypothetical protein